MLSILTNLYPQGMAVLNLFRYGYPQAKNSTHTKPSLTLSRFLRLLIFCVVVCLWAPLASLLAFYYSFVVAVSPWPGWSTVHAHFKRPLLLPSFIQPPELQQVQFFIFWAYETTAFISIASIVSGEGFHAECKGLWGFMNRKFIIHSTVRSPTGALPVRPARPYSSLSE